MYNFTVTQPKDRIIRHGLGNGHTLIANYRLGLVEVIEDESNDYLTLLDVSDDPHDDMRDRLVSHAYLKAKADCA